MRLTNAPGEDSHHQFAGRRRRRELSRLARVGFMLAVVAPAVLWAEPAAARIAVNHNESAGRDRRA